MGNHKDGSRKSRHRPFFSPFSTPIFTFFRACGLVMGTGDEHCPKVLLAGIDTTPAILCLSLMLYPKFVPPQGAPFQGPRC